MAANAVVFPAHGPPVSRMRVTLTLSSVSEPLLCRFCCIGVDMCFKWFWVEVTTRKDNHYHTRFWWISKFCRVLYDLQIASDAFWLLLIFTYVHCLVLTHPAMLSFEFWQRDYLDFRHPWAAIWAEAIKAHWELHSYCFAVARAEVRDLRFRSSQCYPLNCQF